MTSHKTFALSLAGTALLIGCAAPSKPLAVKAVAPNVSISSTDAQALYRIGRYYQSESRHKEAEEAFHAVLAINPAHADARNALGVTYYVQGWMSKAEEQFQLAVVAAPDLPYLRDNLDRLHALTSTSKPAAAMPTKVSPATDPEAAPIASPATATQLVSIAPNVWELKPVAASSATIVLPAKVAVQKTTNAVLSIEIRNGNGVSGLARRVGIYMQAQGLGIARLTNQRHYGQVRTEVQYVAGAEQQARELVAMLSVPARLVPATTLNAQTGIRLVLGRDYRNSETIARALKEHPVATMALAHLHQ